MNYKVDCPCVDEGEIKDIVAGVNSGKYLLSDGYCNASNPGSKGFTYFEPGAFYGFGRPGFNVNILDGKSATTCREEDMMFALTQAEGLQCMSLVELACSQF